MTLWIVLKKVSCCNTYPMCLIDIPSLKVNYTRAVGYNIALRIRKQIFSEDSLPVAAMINDVGVLQLRKGEYSIARTCFSESVRVDSDDAVAADIDNLRFGLNIGRIATIQQKPINASRGIKNQRVSFWQT